jgi:ion channel
LFKYDLFYGQILAGLAICLACIAIHSVFMAVVAWTAESSYRFAEALSERVRLVLVMAGTVTALLVAHVIEICLWGAAYAMLDVAPKDTDALYFAFVNYTTLGYGDVLPTQQWRLLGPTAAMCGILMFGWSTAVIFDVLRNVAQRPAVQAARRR